MDFQEIGAAIARQETQITELCRRMDSLETLTESVHSLALSVRELTTKQESATSRLDSLTTDVNEMKDKPAKRWETVLTAIISALVGAGIAYFIK